jgi:hypothetical protein
MRTTLDTDADILKAAKALAETERKTLGSCYRSFSARVWRRPGKAADLGEACQAMCQSPPIGRAGCAESR